MSGFCHCIKGVSFVVFEQGINDKGKHGHLFFAKTAEKCLRNLLSSEMFVPKILKSFAPVVG